MTTTPTKITRWWGIVIGIGVALSPIHNMRLTAWATNGAGETLFFIPALGYLIWIMGTGLFLSHYWGRVKEIGWGDKRIVIPLLIIVVAIALSGATAEGGQAKFAPLGMGVTLFSLYLTARVIGTSLATPLLVGSCVASLGVLIQQITSPGIPTGGLLFEKNYDIIVGYTLLGVLLHQGKSTWIFATLAISGILLTGSPEGAFALTVLGLTVLIRRDWSPRLGLTLIVIVFTILMIFLSPVTRNLYSYAVDIVNNQGIVNQGAIRAEDDTGKRQAIGYRLDVIVEEMTHIEPLGTGYRLTDFSNRSRPDGRLERIVHNVPLIIVQQLGWPGVLAGLAWLWVSIWCLVKTRWKYVWITIFALSFWDHYIFTQLAPYLWIIAGISTMNNTPDYLFRTTTSTGQTPNTARFLT